MSKRMKVLVSVLAAVLLLTVGGVVTVLAQEEEPPTPERSELRESFLTKVADNLGVSVDELKAAITAAQQEMREKAIIRALDKAVEQGRIIQAEADDILEWWKQKPEVLNRLVPRAFGVPALRSGHMWGGHRGWHGPRPPELAN